MALTRTLVAAAALFLVNGGLPPAAILLGGLLFLFGMWFSDAIR